MENLDKYFSEKLASLEIEPSERANRLFEEKTRVGGKKKTPIWQIISVAASMLLVLGFLFSINLEDFQKKTADKKDNEVSVSKAPAKSAVESKISVNKQEETIEQEIPSVTVKRKELEVLETSNKIVTLESEVGVEPESISESQKRKLAEIELQKLDKNIQFAFYETELTDYSVLGAHQRNLDLRSNNGLLKSSFETDSKKKPLLAKVIKEIKYLVHGEALDLDRAGISPSFAILANRGLIADESRQFRGGIDKLKAVLK